MATQKIELDHDTWVQISTGTESVLLQALKGSVALCVSATEPVGDVAYHVILDMISINPPSTVWIKADSQKAIAVYS